MNPGKCTGRSRPPPLSSSKVKVCRLKDLLYKGFWIQKKSPPGLELQAPEFWRAFKRGNKPASAYLLLHFCFCFSASAFLLINAMPASYPLRAFGIMSYFYRGLSLFSVPEFHVCHSLSCLTCTENFSYFPFPISDLPVLNEKYRPNRKDFIRIS